MEQHDAQLTDILLRVEESKYETVYENWTTWMFKEGDMAPRAAWNQ